MNERLKSFLIYSAKCVLGTIIVLAMAKTFTNLTYYDTMWVLFSVILVLSPDGKDSITFAINRIKANVLGASVGLVFITMFPHHINWILLCVSLVTTIGIGYLLKLDVALRSALIAAVIITMPHDATPSLNTPIERVSAVIAGCLLAVGITYLFHFKEREKLKRRS